MSIHVEPRGLVEASVVHILVIGDEKIQWPCGGLQFGSPVVHVIYGTSKLKAATRPLDFFVSNYQDMHDAGLYQATRFDMDTHLWLPWAEEFFSPASAPVSYTHLTLPTIYSV